MIIPKGNNSNYEFETVNYSNSFFKLKIIDFDEKYEYSKIIQSKANCNNSVHLVIPNPAHNFIEIAGLRKYDNIYALDVLGRIVLNFDWTHTSNKFDIQKLSPGVYYLKVINKGIIHENIRLIKN